MDREWDVLWAMTNATASKLHENGIRDGEIKEPIRCPKCCGERLGGIQCPHCGHQHPASKREVIMEDGKMVTKDGNLIPRKRTLKRHDTQRLWDSMYWGFKNKRVNRTFAQMAAFFVQQHGYWPDRSLNNMPKLRMDWHRHVHAVPREDLRRD